jgi:hypothetical protein
MMHNTCVTPSRRRRSWRVVPADKHRSCRFRLYGRDVVAMARHAMSEHDRSHRADSTTCACARGRRRTATLRLLPAQLVPLTPEHERAALDALAVLLAADEAIDEQ